MIAAGAKLDFADANGVSPLQLAVHKQWIKGVEVLLKAGAIPKPLNENCMEPMRAAAALNNVAILELLIDAGADPNVTVGNGETPLFSAVRAHAVDAAKVLVARGADLERCDPDGKTPLFHAVATAFTAKVITRHFANIADLISAVELPQSQPTQDPRIVPLFEFLLSCRVQLNRQDKEGRNALSYAPSVKLAKMLVEAGASLENKDKKGRSTIDWLKESGIDLTPK